MSSSQKSLSIPDCNYCLEQKAPICVALSSPSGGGKTTLKNRVFEEYKDFYYSISSTTRKKRAYEVDGVDYHFISEESFLKKKKEKGFLEDIYVRDTYYGTDRECLKRYQEGQDVFFDVDRKGVEILKEVFPNLISIFIIPPSLSILESRLIKRDTETQESLKKRLNQAQKEMNDWFYYDYIFINDKIEEVFNDISNVIYIEKCKTKYREVKLNG